MVRWSYVRPFTIAKDVSGIYVGVTSDKRKIYSYCRNSEDAYNKLKPALKPSETLSYVYKDK